MRRGCSSIIKTASPKKAVQQVVNLKAITHWDSESLLFNTLGHPFAVDSETDHKNLCFLYKSDNHPNLN